MSQTSPRAPQQQPSSSDDEANASVTVMMASSPTLAAGDAGGDDAGAGTPPHDASRRRSGELAFGTGHGGASAARLQNSLRVASTRFSTTKGVLSAQVSSTTAETNAQIDDYVASVVANSTEIERHASAMGFHAANGSFISVTEQAVHQTYQQHWWGSFVNAKFEQLYRQRLWKTARTARRGTIICAVFAVIVHLYLIMRGFTFQFDDNNAQPLRTIPSIVLCVGGLAVLFLGFTSWRWVVYHWDAVAFVGMGSMLTSYSSAYATLLCEFVTDDNRDRFGHCAVLAEGYMPWLTVSVVIMTPVVCASALRMNWFWSLVLSVLQVVFGTSSSLRYVAPEHMYQAIFVMCLCVVLATLGSQVREMAERSFWASLYHTARAQFLQEAAERNERDMELKREAADARSKAAQSVMRYVCHELRNPLHGIMGLLDGVRAELDALEAWVTEDVDTIANAATSMSVILNDVLDLGQLQRGAMVLNPVPTDVVALIDRCVLTLQGITTVPIVSHIASSLPDLLTIDPLRVGQIMTNAISNAAKLTTDGSVELIAQLRDGKFWFEVFDTGPGLSGDGTQLFEPYAQDTTGTARTTRTRFDKGTGLGLPIAAQLVRLMKGDIGLENRTDNVQGARFWFWVPSPEPPRPAGVPALTGGVTSMAASSAAGSTWPLTRADVDGLASGATSSLAGRGVGSGALISAGTMPLTPASGDKQYLVHVLPPCEGSDKLAEPKPSVAALIKQATSKSHEAPTVYRTGSSLARERLADSVLTSSPNHGAVLFRDHRSYARGNGVRNAASRRSMGSLSSGGTAAMSHYSGLSRVSSSSAGRADASRCGACAGCRSCTCCERANVINPFTVNQSPRAAGRPTRLAELGTRHAGADAHGPTRSKFLTSGPPLQAVPEGDAGDSKHAPTGTQASQRREHGQASTVPPSWSPVARRKGVGGLAVMSTRDVAKNLVTSPLNATSVRHNRGRVKAEYSTRTSVMVAAASEQELGLPPALAVITSAGDLQAGASAGSDRGFPGPVGEEVHGNVLGAYPASPLAAASSVLGHRPPRNVTAVPAGAPTTSAQEVQETKQAPRAQRRAGRKRKKATKQVDKEFNGVHVLVVDDERVNRTVLKRYCTKVGCTVRMMEDGDELLAVLESQGCSDKGGLPDDGQEDSRDWDVIFLDICMQRSNGEDVCKQLRAANVRTPLVAATGNAVQEDLARYTAAGFNTVMLKPFNGGTVADVLRSLVVKDAPAAENVSVGADV